MRRPPLNAIPLVNLPTSRLVIAVEKRHVVVEVLGAGAEVAAEQGGVGDEHGGDVDVFLFDEDEADADQPLVEHRDDQRLPLFRLSGLLKHRVDVVLRDQGGVFGVHGEGVVVCGWSEPEVGSDVVFGGFEAIDVLVGARRAQRVSE
jgi:hypothetical protein